MHNPMAVKIEAVAPHQICRGVHPLTTALIPPVMQMEFQILEQNAVGFMVTDVLLVRFVVCSLVVVINRKTVDIVHIHPTGIEIAATTVFARDNIDQSASGAHGIYDTTPVVAMPELLPIRNHPFDFEFQKIEYLQPVIITSPRQLSHVRQSRSVTV